MGARKCSNGVVSSQHNSEGSAGRDSNIASSKGKPIGIWLLRGLLWSTLKAIPEEKDWN
jgi:hypothetical protein